MRNHIILASSLFGSVCIFSTSLFAINMSFIENRKIPSEILVLNGLTLGFSGFIFMYYSFKLTNL